METDDVIDEIRVANPGKRDLWISTEKFTGNVTVNNFDSIIETPPVWKKFKGQHLSNLIIWLQKISKSLDIKH